MVRYEYDYTQIDEVFPRLFITGMCPYGERTLWRQCEVVKPLSFDAILNCANFKLPRDLIESVGSYHFLNIHDGYDVPHSIVEGAVDFLKETHGKGQTVLVHCAAGISRSVGMAAAYLAEVHMQTSDWAIEEIHAKRECAGPHYAIHRSVDAYLRNVRRNVRVAS